VRLDPFALAATSLVLGALAALVYGVIAVVRSRGYLERRLAADLDVAVARPVLETEQRPGAIARFLQPLARLAGPGRQEELTRLRAKLVRGGLRGPNAMSLFLASKLGLGGVLLAGGLWWNHQQAYPVEPGLLLAVVTFATGFYAPDLWLSRRTRTRQNAIERGLPDALDLLVTCVEAGLGLDAALQRVAQEVALPWPVLGGELHATFLEARAGIPRVEAFRRLANRTGVQDLKSLAATLTQTELFGTSVALALRIQAEGIRVRRMQKAEERAAYIAVKMTIPLVVFILPTLVAITLGPTVIHIIQIFLKKGAA
jgi:tight adherence protein C